MVFSSAVFLFLFLPIVLLIYYNPFAKRQIYRNVVLFLASIGFYAWGEPVFVFLMLFSVFVTWGFGLMIDRKGKQAGRKIVLVIGVVYHLGILIIFKYLSFIMGQFGLLFNVNLKVPHIELPIGISFFTFQMLSYLFDVYAGKASAQKNVLFVGLYVALFPQLIAGPIVRYDQIAAQLHDRHTTGMDLTEGMQRFILGLGKKVLLANYLAVVADNIFDVYVKENCALATAWLGAIAYTLQIYFDFSGYSDMAIGLGRMFGFSFPENFNYPYIAKSVTDFWRRWHISLSSWFRDYVYIPLGGNRVSHGRWVRNLFVVWLLTGIWHGANWTFVLWGGIYFLFLFMEKVTGFHLKLGVFSHVYTLFIVCLAWVVFRAESIAAAGNYLGKMLGIGICGVTDGVFINYMTNGGMILLPAILLACPLLPKLKKKWGGAWWYEIVSSVGYLGVFLLSLLAVVGETYNPFIYFNF